MTQTLERTALKRGRDSGPAITWISHVLRSRPEARPCDFAASAGVHRKTVVNLLGPSPRPSLYSETYDRIMSMEPQNVKVSARQIVPGAPAKRILDELVRDGWSIKDIGTVADLKRSTLAPHNLDRVQVGTIQALLRAQVILNAQLARGSRSLSSHVPSFLSLRRVEALMAMGWSCNEIARRSDVSVSSLRTSKPRIMHETALKIQDAYFHMRMTPGDSDITRERSQRLGYAPWSAWPNRSMEVESAVPDWGFMDNAEWREAIRLRYEV